MELFGIRLEYDDQPFTAARLIGTVETACPLVQTVTDRIDSRIRGSADIRDPRDVRSALWLGRPHQGKLFHSRDNSVERGRLRASERLVGLTDQTIAKSAYPWR
jgi:hypothetical protein